MRKYQVGDTVLIRDDLTYGRHYPSLRSSDVGVNGDMIDLGGSVATITWASGEGEYSIDLDNGRWTWVASMFEDYVASDFSPGDISVESLLGIGSK